MEKPKNDSSLSESKLTLENIAFLHIVLMKFGGLMTFKETNFWTRARPFLAFQANLFFSFITTMYVLSIVRAIIKTGVLDAGKIAECIGVCGVHFRFIIAYLRRDQVIEMLEAFGNRCAQLSNCEMLVVSSFIKNSLHLCYYYLVSTLFMMILYLGLSQLANYSASANNTRYFPYAFGFDVQVTPWYETLVTIQMVCMFGMCIVCSGIDTSAPFFIMVTCGLYKSLRLRIEEIGNIQHFEPKKDVERKIIACIVFHQQILIFCQKVEAFGSTLFMSQIASSTYNMSLIGLKLVGDDMDKYKFVPLLSIIIIQLFLCQSAPDILINESACLAESIYFMPYSGFSNKKVNQLMHIMLMKCQKPSRITVGGYINLSMECFGSMVTNALSFFTVLRSVN